MNKNTTITIAWNFRKNSSLNLGVKLIDLWVNAQNLRELNLPGFENPKGLALKS